jgi:hypothetical protein
LGNTWLKPAKRKADVDQVAVTIRDFMSTRPLQAPLDRLFQLHGLPTWARQAAQRRKAGVDIVETAPDGQRRLRTLVGK